MSIDSFTTSVGFAALKKANNSGDEEEWNATYDLVKSFNETTETLDTADVMFVRDRIGRRCVINGVGKGVVEDINEATHGLYNGGRYPFLVKRDSDGEIFEYAIHQVSFRSTSMFESLVHYRSFMTEKERSRYIELHERLSDVSLSSKEIIALALKEDDIDLLEYGEIVKKLEASMTVDVEKNDDTV